MKNKIDDNKNNNINTSDYNTTTSEFETSELSSSSSENDFFTGIWFPHMDAIKFQVDPLKLLEIPDKPKYKPKEPKVVDEVPPTLKPYVPPKVKKNTINLRQFVMSYNYAIQQTRYKIQIMLDILNRYISSPLSISNVISIDGHIEFDTYEFEYDDHTEPDLMNIITTMHNIYDKHVRAVRDIEHMLLNF